MTTIATDGRSIAADGRVTAGDEILSDDTRKLFTLTDGSVVGCCGLRAVAEKAAAEFNAAANERREPRDVEGDYRLLRLFPSGALALYDAGVLSRPHFVDPPFAVGSGGEFARGALAGGASLKKALAIAHQYDCRTGPNVTVLKPAQP